MWKTPLLDAPLKDYYIVKGRPAHTHLDNKQKAVPPSDKTFVAVRLNERLCGLSVLKHNTLPLSLPPLPRQRMSES